MIPAGRPVQVLILILIFFWGFRVAFAAPVSNVLGTLPSGVNSPSLRIGSIEGLGQRYNSGGSLVSLGDYNSVTFNSKNLMRLNSKAQDLVKALDQFGNQNLGANINFGVFKVQTRPQVNYTAPVYARGISREWTVAMAVPVLNYTNKISFTSENSNLDMDRPPWISIMP